MTESLDNTVVVLTLGLGKEELFQLNTAKCQGAEARVYLAAMQTKYEKVFGEEIWSDNDEGYDLKIGLKENVLAKLSQVKAMNLLAKESQITLDTDELEKAKNAAELLFDSFSEEQKELLMIDENLLVTMYEEYALANKVYEYLTRDINPEISDDEARTITVEHIFLKTYSQNGVGDKISYDDEQKTLVYQKALECLQRAKDGTDFNTLITEYSEDESLSYSFRKGEKEASFEKAAFELANDEISGIVDTEYGYYIIKCLNTFNKEETEANKTKIVEERRKQVFEEEYQAFTEKLVKNINEELWQSITVFETEEPFSTEFFEIFDFCFSK